VKPSRYQFRVIFTRGPGNVNSADCGDESGNKGSKLGDVQIVRLIGGGELQKKRRSNQENGELTGRADWERIGESGNHKLLHTAGDEFGDPSFRRRLPIEETGANSEQKSDRSTTAVISGQLHAVIAWLTLYSVPRRSSSSAPTRSQSGNPPAGISYLLRSSSVLFSYIFSL
jgi:hypothetical protein